MSSVGQKCQGCTRSVPPGGFLDAGGSLDHVRSIKMTGRTRRVVDGRKRRRPRQLGLEFHTWGGAREGAGRKPKVPGKSGLPHRPRLRLERRLPVHVTLRVAEQVWNLRSRRSFAVLAPALQAGMDRFGVRLVKFSVQGNHIHLLVETGDKKTLGRAIKGLSVRIARGLNQMMGRRGRVFADRYHARALRTPAELRNAISTIGQNARKHAAERGERLPQGWVDPYSSDSPTLGFVLPEATTWLARVGWRRGKR